MPINEESWLRNAARSRVSVTRSEFGNPTTPIRSIGCRPAMNRDAAASAGRPSSRLMCAWSTATTTIRPSPAPWFELKWVAETGSGGLADRRVLVDKLCRNDATRTSIHIDPKVLGA